MSRRGFVGRLNRAPGGVVDGLEVWQRDDRGVRVDGSGRVPQWDNWRADRFHSTQATVANMPELVTVGGRQRIKFTAAALLANCSFMSAAASPAMSGAKPRTLILVYEPLATAGAPNTNPGELGYVYSAGAWSNPNTYSVRSTGSATSPYSDPNATVGGSTIEYLALRELKTCLVEFSFDGANMRVRKNNGAYQVLAALANTDATKPTYLGRNGNPSAGVNAYFHGYIRERIEYSRLLTPAEFAGIDADINARQPSPIW